MTRHRRPAHNGDFVAIIGAGIAGLSYRHLRADERIRLTSTRCTRNPADSAPPGTAAYTIDACIHWFTGSRPGSSLYKLWREIGLVQHLDLIDLDEFMRVKISTLRPSSSTPISTAYGSAPARARSRRTPRC